MKKKFRLNLLAEEQNTSKIDSIEVLKNSRLKDSLTKLVLGGIYNKCDYNKRFGRISYIEVSYVKSNPV